MSITLEHLRQLPQTYRVTVPEDYLDEMGHMNIRWYFAIYDRAAWGLFEHFGMTLEHYQQTQTGAFALKQFVQYLAEVLVGDTVVVHSRLVARSAKRVHFMHFMWNETQNVLASTLEVLASHADLTVRRTAPFPAEIAALLDATIAEHGALRWQPPLCGVLAP